MAGEYGQPPMDGAQPPAGAPAPKEQRVVSPEDKALAADWLKRIETALARPGIKEAIKRFEENRKLLRGIAPDGTKMQANLYYANLATMRPQVYAKDPEYAVQPSKGVPEAQLKLVRGLCQTLETVLGAELVKRTKLKKRAKRLLTSAYTTSVGWWKCCWQEDKRTDPLIANQIKDTQDNLIRLERLRDDLADPDAASDTDKQRAQLQQMLEGLQTQAEVVVSRGLTLDFVLSEDILILDASVREIGDYERASAIAHRVWMSRDAFHTRFKYASEKGKSYSEQSGGGMQNGPAGDKKTDLLCVWEIWEQDSNRIFHVCDGEEGFPEPPSSPDWTGERWYPFFMMAFNEIEGTFYPLSDIELTEPQISEINNSAKDFKRDRKASLPLNIARKGGSLTDDDMKRIRDREGADIIMVEGVGGQPISNDIWSGQLAQIKPENYDTSQSRSFMEQIVGGGDAARGTVQNAKTATEAEILSQGLRGRSAERTDTMEDLLTELGNYAAQVLLRKLSADEVKQIAGPDAVWPTLNIEQIFTQISIEVRGGSTGKPDRLQDQDRWTKMLPVIEKTIEQVSELRAKGQEPLADALVELTRETLRRFDERIDIDQFLPPKPQDGSDDPATAMQQLMAAKAKLDELTKELADEKEKNEKGYISAAAQIATSANPLVAAQAFGMAITALEQHQAAEEAAENAPNPAQTPMPGQQTPPMPPQSGIPQPPPPMQ